jgi:hypothetical protein
VGTWIGKLKAPTIGIALIKLHPALIIQTVLILYALPNEGVVVGGGLGRLLHAGPLARLIVVLPS